MPLQAVANVYSRSPVQDTLAPGLWRKNRGRGTLRTKGSKATPSSKLSISCGPQGPRREAITLLTPNRHETSASSVSIQDARRLWEAALGELQVSVDRDQYRTWLRDTTGLSLIGDQL